MGESLGKTDMKLGAVAVSGGSGYFLISAFLCCLNFYKKLFESENARKIFLLWTKLNKRKLWMTFTNNKVYPWHNHLHPSQQELLPRRAPLMKQKATPQWPVSSFIGKQGSSTCWQNARGHWCVSMGLYGSAYHVDTTQGQQSTPGTHLRVGHSFMWEVEHFIRIQKE